MPRPAKKARPAKDSTANLGFEAAAVRVSVFIPSAAISCRVRRTHRHLRHNHQESAQIGLTAFLPSSFILRTWLAWVQHFIHHLAPQGMAGFVLANGSMSSNQSGEGDRTIYPLCD